MAFMEMSLPVLRDSIVKVIDFKEIVPGDIIFLK